MDYMNLKTTSLIAIFAIALTSILLGTNPQNSSSIVLVLPFCLLFIACLVIVFTVMRRGGAARLRSMRVAFVSAGLPVSLLLLQSIGQLTARDIITISIFFGLAYFYISKLTPAD